MHLPRKPLEKQVQPPAGSTLPCNDCNCRIHYKCSDTNHLCMTAKGQKIYNAIWAHYRDEMETPAARADCPLIRNFRKALLINTPPPYSVNKVLSLIGVLTLLYSSCLEMNRTSHCPLQSTRDQEENLNVRATIL